MPNPFLEALTGPPVNLSRLNAKFISAMHKEPKSELIDAKKLLRNLGYFLPPENELLALKKAVVGNEVDLTKVFSKNRNKVLSMPEFAKEFSLAKLDLVPRPLNQDDLNDIHDYADVCNKLSGTIFKPDLDIAMKNNTPTNEKIVQDILEHGTEATQE